MRIAILSDTHGNLIALAAVLADLEKERYDRLVFLGDAAAFGPQPAETIEALQQLDPPCVMGNTDEMLLKELDEYPQLAKNRPLREQLAWGQARLTADHRAFLERFRPTLFFPFEDGDRIYRVRKGDSLWKISRLAGVPLDTLMKWNGLTSRSVIRPGQRLIVGKSS